MPTSSLPSLDWDSGLISEGGHFLQSRSWAEFQANMGRQVVFAAGAGWRWLGMVQGQPLTYLYSPYGPTVGGDLEGALDSLLKTANELGCAFVRFEPRVAFDAPQLAELAKQVKEVQPQFTSVLDLTAELGDIRKAMAEGHRYSVSAAPKRGVTVRTSQDPKDVSIFWSMMESTADRSEFVSHPRKYFETLTSTLMPTGTVKLYFAEESGDPVASAIAFDFGQTRYYAFAGAFAERSRKVFAGVYLCWQMICDAKDDGLSKFDFWGIAPPNAPEDHAWAGLSKFKRSFGGQDISTLGTWEIQLEGAKNRLKNLARKLK